MPKGEHLKGENSPRVQFSSEYQPENRRKPDLITSLLKEELAGDGWAIFEDAEVLDDDKKPTGQKVRVRIKQTTARAVARRLAANAASGRERSIEIVLDRTEGKVPQKAEFEHNLSEQTAQTILKISFRPPEDEQPIASSVQQKPKGARKKV